ERGDQRAGALLFDPATDHELQRLFSLRYCSHHSGAHARVMGPGGDESGRNKRQSIQACGNNCTERTVSFHPYPDVSAALFAASPGRQFVELLVTADIV